MRTLYGHEINSNNTESNTGMISGAWYNSNPVTSISFFVPAGGSFAEGTKFALYGVK